MRANLWSHLTTQQQLVPFPMRGCSVSVGEGLGPFSGNATCAPRACAESAQGGGCLPAQRQGIVCLGDVPPRWPSSSQRITEEQNSGENK